jgi:hypothetical protein
VAKYACNMLLERSSYVTFRVDSFPISSRHIILSKDSESTELQSIVRIIHIFFWIPYTQDCRSEVQGRHTLFQESNVSKLSDIY